MPWFTYFSPSRLVQAPGLQEWTRSVSWPDVVHGTRQLNQGYLSVIS